MATHPSHLFDVRCKIEPANPYVHIDSGGQTHNSADDPLGSNPVKQGLIALSDIGDKAKADAYKADYAYYIRNIVFPPKTNYEADIKDKLLTRLFRHEEMGPKILTMLKALAKKEGIKLPPNQGGVVNNIKTLWLNLILHNPYADIDGFIMEFCHHDMKEAFTQIVESTVGIIKDVFTKLSPDPKAKYLEPLDDLIKIGPSGIIKINGKLYEQAYENVIQAKIDHYPERITQLRKHIRKHSDKRKISYGYPNTPYLSVLEQQDAEAVVHDSLAALNPVYDTALLRIALADANLKLIISNQPHIEHISEKRLDRTYHDVWCGFRGTNYIMLPSGTNGAVIAEELAHHAIAKIYTKGERALPYTSFDDPRRKLLNTALLKDITKAGYAQFEEDYHFHSYNINQIQAEVPAKTMAMIATGEWEHMRFRYPSIDRYMKEIILRDAERFEREGKIDMLSEQEQSQMMNRIAASSHNLSM